MTLYYLRRINSWPLLPDSLLSKYDPSRTFWIFLAMSQGMWDLRSPTRNRTCIPRSEALEVQSLNHWTSRKVHWPSETTLSAPACMCVLSCSIRSDFCDPMNCSPPGSSVHGILQARLLQWVAIPFSRGSSQPRDWNQVSLIAGGLLTIWATKEAS